MRDFSLEAQAVKPEAVKPGMPLDCKSDKQLGTVLGVRKE